MEDVKVNIYNLEKVYLNLKAEINLLEVWNNDQEDTPEIKLILKTARNSLKELENITYGLDDILILHL